MFVSDSVPTLDSDPEGSAMYRYRFYVHDMAPERLRGVHSAKIVRSSRQAARSPLSYRVVYSIYQTEQNHASGTHRRVSLHFTEQAVLEIYYHLKKKISHEELKKG